MTDEQIAEKLYEIWRAAMAEEGVDVEEVWKELEVENQAAWVAVARFARRVK